jgi:hypothetical protein
MNIHAPTNTVGFNAIRMETRKVLNGHEAVAQQSLILAGKRFEKLNDLIVNEQTVIH